MRNTPWVFALLLALATPALAECIELANGDSLHGTIVESKDEAIVLDHPVLGRLEIRRGQIAGTAAPGAEAEASPDGAAPVDERKSGPDGEALAPEKPGLFGTGFLEGWSRHLSLGMSGSQGKSKEARFNGQLTTRYESDRSRWEFDTAYFFSSSDGEAETNEIYAQLNKDWLLPDSKWFFFLEGRYDYDEFDDWDHRVAGSTGVGYEFVKREAWDLVGRVGGGASRTIGGEERLTPEALVALDAVWRVTDGQTVRAANSIFVDMSDPGEFRTLSTIDWILAISRRYGLSLKLSLMNEYESLAREEQNDFKYVGALVYDF